MTAANRTIIISNQKPDEQLVASLSVKGQVFLQIISDVLDEKSRDQQPISAMDILLGIAHEFGGSQVYVPQEQSVRSFLFHKEIVEDFEQGLSVAELAKNHRISNQSVYRIIEQHKSKGDKPCH
ncbi:MAG: Mor transcription activator family protein [Marinomonas sp.]|uniref:Mor transcription activator family protein n=1 Tax=Marinomonas sp. TaxID=1904862 RepID=UPI003F960B41